MSSNLAYFTAIQAGVPAVALGRPGMGKTSVMYAFGRAANRRVFTFVPSVHDATDLTGCPFPEKATITDPDGEQREITITRIGSPDWALDFFGQDSIFFGDELTTAAPILQAAMLRIFAEKFIGNIELPENTWLAGAANPPETAPSGIPFCSPLANRIYHHAWEVDREAVLDGFSAGLQFENPKFDILPENWQDNMPTTGSMVSAFHQHVPNLLDNEPDDADGQSGPWPSQRSWANAVRAMTAAQSIGAGQMVERQLAEGIVGRGAAGEYFEWLDNLDLPDPVKVLGKAMDIVANGSKKAIKELDGLRNDQIIALLGRVTQLVNADLAPERWLGAMHLVEVVSEKKKNLALGVVRPLARMAAPGGSLSGKVQLPESFVETIYPYIQRTIDS